MPTVADYAVLRDNAFELGPGESLQTPVFTNPDNLVFGTNRARAILAFRARAVPNPPSPLVIATVNVRSSGFMDGLLTGVTVRDSDSVIWETFPVTGFGENIGTVFEFEVVSGRVVIQDVILWHQVRVGDP
jgi:hypothetical protein